MEFFMFIGFMTVVCFLGSLMLIASIFIIEKCEAIGTILVILSYILFTISLPVFIPAYFILKFFTKRITSALEKEHNKEIVKYIDMLHCKKDTNDEKFE